MSFSSVCRTSFESRDIRLGDAYYMAGRVKITEADRSSVTATVRGSGGEPYEVEVEWSESNAGYVVASCTCPHFDDGALCKHIWATLRKAERESKAPSPTARRLDVVRNQDRDDAVRSNDERDDSENEDEGDDQENRHETMRALHFPIAGGVSGAGRKVTPQGRSPVWRQRLNTIAETAATAFVARHPQSRNHGLRDREAWYAINVAASQKKGELIIDFRQRERRQDGQFGKIKKLAVAHGSLDNFIHEEDRRLLELLLGCEPEQNYSRGYYSYAWRRPDYLQSRVVPSLYDSLLPRLCATGRLIWLLDSSLTGDDGRLVSWDAGEPWRFRLHATSDARKKKWQVTGQLYRGDETLALQEPVLLLSTGVVLLPDRLARFCGEDDLPWISQLRQNPTIDVPYSAREAFLERWFAMPRIPQSVMPPQLEVETVLGSPVGKLQIRRPKRSPFGYLRTELIARGSFVYGDESIQFDDLRAGFFHAAEDRAVLRDPQRERELLDQLRSLRLRRTNSYRLEDADGVCFDVSEKRLAEVVRTLTAFEWIVEAEGLRVRRPGEISLSVRSNVDWFELEGSVDFGGVTASLPSLLAAVRNQQTMVRLGDGSQGVLPEKWLKKYGALIALGEGDGDTLKFRPSQALLLDVLVAEHEHARVDGEFLKCREKLCAFDGVRPQAAPPGFCGELREYQKDGLGWLQFLQDFRFGGCLADDMGLGKTVQVLAMLEFRRIQAAEAGRPHSPSIVVVPRSLVFNWIEEAARFTPGLRIFNHTGSDRKQRLAATPTYDVLVTTYGTLRNDIVELRKLHFDYAILDEAQAIKNQSAQASKASRLLSADHRLALTGTPVENHLGELWSLFEFLNPGMLGRSTAFATFAKRGADGDLEYLTLLARALRPFLLRRTKGQVLRELPEKTEQTLHCEMSPQERRKYDQLRDYYRAQLADRVRDLGLAKAKIHVLEALLRLRQAACHPGLLDRNKSYESSAKLDTLLEQIEEVIEEGHKALVFSQFTSLLAIVRHHLDRRGTVYEYLDGSTRDRGERVKRFQEDPACPLFLISLKAGGHGLNLTAADYVFILDPWWNPAVEAQAIDRTHRIGQTRRVFAYRLIAKDTVEDKIIELQKTKRDLADAIISADNSLIRQLTVDDLQLLLS